MKVLNIIVFLIFGFLLNGCETAPPVKPVSWVRTLNTNNQIKAGSRIFINVIGDTIPLSGNEELVRNMITEYAADLLSRRGYIISKTDFDYKFNISYLTNMGSRLSINSETTSYISSRFSNSNMYLTGSSIFYNTTIINIHETSAFLHTMTVNILDINDNLIWTGDTAWETSDLNILLNAYMVFKNLFINLPKTNNVLANVPKVKESRIIDYYMHYCHEKWFTPLALPYNIRFEPLLRIKENPNDQNSPLITILPYSITESQNLAAYVDLIIMSVFALPGGSVDNWINNPLDDKLWIEASMGGRYILGENEVPINIIINLKKISGGNGYVVTNCLVVNDDEYSKFLENMVLWQNIIRTHYIEFYNFYE